MEDLITVNLEKIYEKEVPKDTRLFIDSQIKKADKKTK